jgi:WD40 repeat protein
MNKSLIFIGLMLLAFCGCSQSTPNTDIQSSSSQSSGDIRTKTASTPDNLMQNPARTPRQSLTPNPTATKTPETTPTATSLPTFTSVALSGLPAEREVILLNNVDQLQPLLEFNIGSQINQVAWSKYSGDFAVGANGGVYVYNPDTMKLIGYNKGSADTIAFSPTQPVLAIGPNPITLWNIETGEKMQIKPEGKASSQMMFDLAFSPDGRILASSAEGGLIELWDTTNGNKIFDLVYNSSELNDVFHLVFTPDGKYLISEINSIIVVWEVATGNLVNEAYPISHFAEDLDLSDDGQYLALLSEDIIHILDASKAGQKIAIPIYPLLEIEGYTLFNETTMKIAFSHHDNLIFAGSYNGDLGAWSLDPVEGVFLEKGYLYSIDDLELSYDGRTLLTVCFDGTVILWGTSSES